MLAELGARALRLLPPEAAHEATIRLLSKGVGVPARAGKIPESLAVMLPKSGLTFASPVGLAAGFDKNCEAPEAMAKFGFGFVECGTVTPKPQPGNPKPRLFRLEEDRAVINRMGFNNYGLDYFVRRLAKYSHVVPIGANVGANKDSEDRAQDYVTGIVAVAPHADYITINISSPNTPGLRGLQSRAELETLLTRLGAARARQMRQPPTLLKIAPDLGDDELEDIARCCDRGAVDGIIVSNTTLRRDGLASPARGEAGGLSGAPLFALSTRVLAKVYLLTGGKLPLIGAGGIGDAETAWIKLRAGATLLQLYSALVYAGPALVEEILTGLAARLAASGQTLDAVRGCDAAAFAHQGLSGT
jgi:dihydroorotate dehydrogenase